MYLIANRHIYYRPGMEEQDLRPFYRDSAASDESIPVDYSEIRCFPDFTMANYLIVARINLDSPQEKASFVNTLS